MQLESTQRGPRGVAFFQWVVLSVLALAMLVACEDGDDTIENVQPTSTPSSAASPAVSDERLVRDDSPTQGPDDARVVLVEFLDPECEYCRAAFPVVKALLEEYPDDLRLVVRYFPLHTNSVLAVLATEAAGNQGKYWEMHELLFERQAEWGEQQAPQREKFVEYARELSLDIGRFEADLSDTEIEATIARDQADGTALGVTGTPTFFVNGGLVTQPSYDSLKAAIDGILDE